MTGRASDGKARWYLIYWNNNEIEPQRADQLEIAMSLYGRQLSEFQPEPESVSRSTLPKQLYWVG
jgi:hypothetical protein